MKERIAVLADYASLFNRAQAQHHGHLHRDQRCADTGRTSAVLKLVTQFEVEASETGQHQMRITLVMKTVTNCSTSPRC